MILALVGPTASGKTMIALDLAPSFGAEIVSVDSMQVYRGMDVGTAKPSPAEQRSVPHHLIDLVEPGKAFSVAEYQRAARAAIQDVTARGKRAMLVGGSGLYFRAIVDDLGFPPTDASVRERLARHETTVLWDRLVREDPDAAARIEPRNARRIVRALEVIELTGKRFSSFRTAWDDFDPDVAAVAGLRVSGPVLRARIERRARAMFDGPIQEETRRLVEAGHREALEAAAAIGYREALDLIEGRAGVEEAVERVVRATAGLARRQMRWFRRDPRIRWIDADELERAAAGVAAYWTEPRTAAVGGA